MKMIICDSCEKPIKAESNGKSFGLYHPQLFTVTERPHSSPYTHTVFPVDENSLVKHFCSEGCIGEFYNNNKK